MKCAAPRPGGVGQAARRRATIEAMNRPKPLRSLLALIGLLLWLVTPAWPADGHAAAGEAVYRLGVLPSGAMLRGEREAGVRVEALGAACVTCHRPSGLGTTEGRIVVPPIIGKYLFRPHSTNVRDMSLPHVVGYRSTREPYTDASLARAIREGVGPNGRTLNYLMPRYALDDATMASLVEYLKGLSSDAVPGVSDSTLHFATIITPDADPVQRKGMLDVMERFFADKNAFIRGGVRPMQATREIEYRVSRRWQLHVWELTGAPDQWERQLRAHLAAEPVYAVISGLGRRNWEPVHRFCQAEALPCLLPNVDLPVTAEGEFYPVYFSRGVLLEADLVAGRVFEQREAAGLQRVVQVFREGDVGESAAAAFAKAVGPTGLRVESHVLEAASPSSRAGDELAGAMKDLGPDDVLLLWLRGEDLARLPADMPRVSMAFVSGALGGLEHAPLPAAWHAAVHMTYPADLPELRKIRMNFPLGWFKIKQIDVVAEKVQTDTYVALGILAETLTDMLDSFVRDYLVERVEVMLSHRQVNGYYPRLSLAPGQRFASKGGYIVRFAGPQGAAVVADGEWIVP